MQTHQVGRPYQHPDKSGFKNTPFAAIEIKHWSDGFKKCRTDKRLSNHDIAHQLGIPQKLVREWCDAQAYPTSVQLSRMYTRLPKLRTYAHLLPAVVRHDPQKDPATGAPVSQDVQVAMIEPDMPKDMPAEFGPFLKEVRLRSGARASEIAELLDPPVSASAVNNWEAGNSNPVPQNYEQLCALMPALKDGPKPKLSKMAYTAIPGRRTGAGKRLFAVATAASAPPPTPPPPAPERPAPSPAPSPPSVSAVVASEPSRATAPPVLSVVPPLAPVARLSGSLHEARERGANEDTIAYMNAAGAAYGVAVAAFRLAQRDLEAAQARMEDAVAQAHAR